MFSMALAHLDKVIIEFLLFDYSVLSYNKDEKWYRLMPLILKINILKFKWSRNFIKVLFL